jgi:hypothetical protein
MGTESEAKNGVEHYHGTYCTYLLMELPKEQEPRKVEVMLTYLKKISHQGIIIWDFYLSPFIDMRRVLTLS